MFAHLDVLAFGAPGPFEFAIILVIALLIFGKRLPEVMRSMGRGVIEFKKGIRGIEEDIKVDPDRQAKISTSNTETK